MPVAGAEPRRIAATSARGSLPILTEEQIARADAFSSGAPEMRLGSPLKGVGRLAAYLLVTLALLPVQMVAVALKAGLAARLPRTYHRLCARLLGFQIECYGDISPLRPTLFVGNHSSYIDITLYGAVIPGSFVAKAEVAGWPLFGLLAKLQRTVFVDRRRASTRDQRDDMARRLEAGDNLILFPEGTSDDGNHTLPFRSALLSVAERRVGDLADPAAPPRALPVQPVSLAYTRLNGMPIGYFLRPFFAWYGDMGMPEHLWRWIGLGRTTVVVQFHPVVTIDEFGSRKALTEHCYRVVSSGVTAALAGRYLTSPDQIRTSATRGGEGPTDELERSR